MSLVDAVDSLPAAYGDDRIIPVNRYYYNGTSWATTTLDASELVSNPSTLFIQTDREMGDEDLHLYFTCTDTSDAYCVATAVIPKFTPKDTYIPIKLFGRDKPWNVKTVTAVRSFLGKDLSIYDDLDSYNLDITDINGWTTLEGNVYNTSTESFIPRNLVISIDQTDQEKILKLSYGGGNADDNCDNAPNGTYPYLPQSPTLIHNISDINYGRYTGNTEDDFYYNFYFKISSSFTNPLYIGLYENGYLNRNEPFLKIKFRAGVISVNREYFYFKMSYSGSETWNIDDGALLPFFVQAKINGVNDLTWDIDTPVTMTALRATMDNTASVIGNGIYTIRGGLSYWPNGSVDPSEVAPDGQCSYSTYLAEGIGSYTFDTWHHLEIHYDSTNSNFNFRLDGESVGSNIDPFFDTSGIPYNTNFYVAFNPLVGTSGFMNLFDLKSFVTPNNQMGNTNDTFTLYGAYGSIARLLESLFESGETQININQLIYSTYTSKSFNYALDELGDSLGVSRIQSGVEKHYDYIFRNKLYPYQRIWTPTAEGLQELCGNLAGVDDSLIEIFEEQEPMNWIVKIPTGNAIDVRLQNINNWVDFLEDTKPLATNMTVEDGGQEQALMITDYFANSLTNCNIQKTTTDQASLHERFSSALKITALADNASATLYVTLQTLNDIKWFGQKPVLRLRVKYNDIGAYVGGRTPDMIAHVHDVQNTEITKDDIDSEALATSWENYSADKDMDLTVIATSGRSFLTKLQFSDIGWTNIADYQTIDIGDGFVKQIPE